MSGDDPIFAGADDVVRPPPSGPQPLPPPSIGSAPATLADAPVVEYQDLSSKAGRWLKGKYIAHRDANATLKAAKAEQRATEKAVEASTRVADEAAAQNPPTAPAFAPPDRLSKPWRDLTDQTQTAYKPRSLHLDSPPEYPEMPMLQRDPKATGEFLNALDALAALSTLDAGTMPGSQPGRQCAPGVERSAQGQHDRRQRSCSEPVPDCPVPLLPRGGPVRAGPRRRCDGPMASRPASAPAPKVTD